MYAIYQSVNKLISRSVNQSVFSSSVSQSINVLDYQYISEPASYLEDQQVS